MGNSLNDLVSAKKRKVRAEVMGSSKEAKGEGVLDGGQGGEDVPGVRDTRHNLKQRYTRDTAWNFIHRTRTDENLTSTSYNGNYLKGGGRSGAGEREMVFEFGRRMGEGESEESPTKRLKLQHTPPTTSLSQTPARPPCPPPSPWIRKRIRPAAPPPTLPGNAGAGSWPPPPAVLVDKVAIEGRVAQMESRGTSQTPRG